MHTDLPASDAVGNDEGKRARRLWPRAQRMRAIGATACLRAADLDSYRAADQRSRPMDRAIGIIEHARHRLLRHAGASASSPAGSPSAIDRTAITACSPTSWSASPARSSAARWPACSAIALSTASSAIWSSPSSARSSSSWLFGPRAAERSAGLQPGLGHMVTVLDTLAQASRRAIRKRRIGPTRRCCASRTGSASGRRARAATPRPARS